MPTLREALSPAGAVCLDAASSRIQVGRLSAAAQGEWCTSEDEAGVALFECLRRLGIRPNEVPCWIYCEGPGSILGIRTVAAALRAWQVMSPSPVFSYCSLAVVAHGLPDPDVAVIADARRDSWHHYRRSTGLRREATSALTGPLMMPEGFRHWSSTPPAFTRVPYDLSSLLPRVLDLPLVHPCTAPDAFLHEEPTYVTWTPQIHRAKEH